MTPPVADTALRSRAETMTVRELCEMYATVHFTQPFCERAALAELERRCAQPEPVRGEAVGVDYEGEGAPFYFALCSFISRLKRVRRESGLTLAEVAEQSGIAESSLSRLENGRLINPTWKTLGQYAIALGHGLKLTAEILPPNSVRPRPAETNQIGPDSAWNTES